MTNLFKVTSNKVKFFSLYLISLILIGIIMAAFWQPLLIVPQKVSASIAKDEHLDDDEVVIADKLLHRQLNELYKLDEQYNTVITGNNLKVIRTINEKVNKAEQALQKSIDSLEQAKTNFKSTISSSVITSITSSFKNALIAYRNSKAIRGDVNSKNLDLRNEDIIGQLTADVKKRDERIKELENLYRIRTQNKPVNIPPDIKKMQQENEFLSSSLRDLTNKNERLTQANYLQRKNIEKLNKQIEAFRKFVDAQ